MPNEPTCLQSNAAFQKYKSLQISTMIEVQPGPLGSISIIL